MNTNVLKYTLQLQLVIQLLLQCSNWESSHGTAADNRFSLGHECVALIGWLVTLEWRPNPRWLQPIWVKICIHHLLVRPYGYPESKIWQNTKWPPNPRWLLWPISRWSIPRWQIQIYLEWRFKIYINSNLN